MPLQGACLECCFWSLIAVLAAECCCRVPRCCLRFGAWLLVPLAAVCALSLVAGAAAICCCKVLLSECRLRCGAWLLGPLQGAASEKTFECCFDFFC